jgi:hypothetical protein
VNCTVLSLREGLCSGMAASGPPTRSHDTEPGNRVSTPAVKILSASAAPLLPHPDRHAWGRMGSFSDEFEAG